jgi:hypothetical protein
VFWGLNKESIAPQANFFNRNTMDVTIFGALIVDFFLSQLGLPDL